METLILDSATYNLFKTFISEIGFPIFVSAYLLFMKHKQDQGTMKLVEELKCVQSQLLETKLQIGDKVVKP